MWQRKRDVYGLVHGTKPSISNLLERVYITLCLTFFPFPKGTNKYLSV